MVSGGNGTHNRQAQPRGHSCENKLHRGLLQAKTSLCIITPPCGKTVDTQLLCSRIPQTRVKFCRLKKLLKLMKLLICKHRGGWFVFLYESCYVYSHGSLPAARKYKRQTREMDSDSMVLFHLKGNFYNLPSSKYSFQSISNYRFVQSVWGLTHHKVDD